MDLIEQVFTIEKTMNGTDSFTVNAGDNLKIMNGNTEILKQKPPNGKKWQVEIRLKIDESSV